MKYDIKSNVVLQESIAANVYGAGIINSTSVDHSLYSTVSYLISAGDLGIAGTISVKTQYSNDNTNWTDYPANDTLLANDNGTINNIVFPTTAQLNITNPRGQYSRVVATVGVNSVRFAIISAAGPKLHC